jgi:Protein of unknown function (DUF1214)
MTTRPPTNSWSKTCPWGALWSISVYNAQGYFEPNKESAYSVNNLTAKKSADGSVAIQFGGAYGERVETPDALAEALRRALDNAPAVLDVLTSQSVVSSDAKKGLGYIPDYQPLTAWDDAERRRRGLELQ